MEFVFELFFQFFGEFLLQVLLELFAEWGAHQLSERLAKRRHPLVSLIGYMIWGGVAGGLSLLVLPHSQIGDPNLRLISLFLIPVVIGILMVAIGRLRAKKGQDLIRLDRFVYAFAFAFTMGLVRFIWAS